jgi:hypothetical protein
MRSGLVHEKFVGIAPHPVFAWLEGADDRVFLVAVVSGGVFVLGRVAATHVAASEAEAQVDPGVSHFKTFFAASAAGFDFVNLIEVRALLCHDLLLSCYPRVARFDNVLDVDGSGRDSQIGLFCPSV